MKWHDRNRARERKNLRRFGKVLVLTRSKCSFTSEKLTLSNDKKTNLRQESKHRRSGLAGLSPTSLRKFF